MHVMKDELDDTIRRVVLPRSRQGQVLRLAHTSTLAGHFGARKTRDRLIKHFMWPRLWKAVKEYC